MRVGPLLLLCFLAAGLSAQENAPVVADVIVLDVAVAYGDQTPSRIPLAESAVELDRREEPGLVLRLSRVPVRSGVPLDLGQSPNAQRLSWTATESDRGEQGIVQWQLENQWQYYLPDGSASDEAHWIDMVGDRYRHRGDIWHSDVAFQVWHEDTWRMPEVSGGSAEIRFTLILPRLGDDNTRGAVIPPSAGEITTITQLLEIATDRCRESALASPREFVVELARFIPMKDELPEASLLDLLDLEQAREKLEEVARQAVRPGARRRRRENNAFVDNNRVYRHQGLLRSGLVAAPPWQGRTWMSIEYYAVYRQLIESGAVAGPAKAALLDGLLDLSTDTEAHATWIAMLEDGRIQVDEPMKSQLLKRLRDEIAARDPVALGLLAALNVAGLAGLILGIRLVCRRLLFR